MSVKKKKPWLDWLVYFAVRFTVCFVQALPVKVAYGFAGWLAWLAYRVDKRHRKVAEENLKFAFPEKSAAEHDEIIRGCYRHFCTMVIEIALLPRMLRVHNWRQFVDNSGGWQIVPRLLDSRPALIVCGHYGNWELAGYALGVFGFSTYAIARVLDNPHLEKFLKHFRQRTGQVIIRKRGDFDDLTEVMQTGGKVATLADQDAGSKGVFVNFFNRPASAHKAVALMAIGFDAVMVVTGTSRLVPPELGRMRYVIECEDVIDPRDYAGRSDVVKAITQRYHDALERLIRKHPEQYFWLHRRWKSTPPEKKPKPTSAAA